MLQFFLLSILSLILTGLVLSGDFLGVKVPALAGFRSWLENRGAAAALGVVTAAIGVLKLIWPIGVAVAGDLLPALGGMAVGAVLALEAVLRKPGAKAAKGYVKAVLSYRVPIGVAALVIAVLHFLFPRATIL